jgi:TetR/AcrR family fatty acid metabolism transcriptional regulator
MNSERQQRRSAQILKAALEVFAAEGYHDASVADVARAAGVSEKTVYDYFPSKEELLFQIPVEPTLEAIRTLERTLPYVRGAANKIRTIIYHFVLFYAEHREYATVILLFLNPNSNFLKTETFKRLRNAFRVIDAAVEEGIAAGEFAPDTDSALVRRVVMGAVDNIVLRWLQHGVPENPVVWVDPLADLIVHGITSGAGAGGWTLRLSIEPGTAREPEVELAGSSEDHAPSVKTATRRPQRRKKR